MFFFSEPTANEKAVPPSNRDIQSKGGQTTRSRISKAHKGKFKSVPRPGDKTEAKWNPGISCYVVICRGMKDL